MYRLQDFFIGDYPITEYFGANPAIYTARYNIQGYPGIRIGCPTLTPILSTSDGFVLETGFEEAGKGKYITIVHDGYLTTYGHLNDILVQKDEKVTSGQLIGHSNQSGLTESPCLYFGIAPCDGGGTKTVENGYSGYIDPMGDEVEWDVKNLKEPVTKNDLLDKMTLDSHEYAVLNAQATNYKVLISFLKQKTTFDEVLKGAGRAPVNLDLTPDDSAGGEAVTFYLSTIADDFEELNTTIEELQKTPQKLQPVVPSPTIPLVKGDSFLVKLKSAIKRFIFAD